MQMKNQMDWQTKCGGKRSLTKELCMTNPLKLCPLLTPYLKILDLSTFFVVDTPMNFFLFNLVLSPYRAL